MTEGTQYMLKVSDDTVRILICSLQAQLSVFNPLNTERRLLYLKTQFVAQ